jgi:hypothetical protein
VPAAVIKVPTTIDFGSIGVGESSNKSLQIQNKGAAVLSGSVNVGAPANGFALLTSSFSVPAHGTQTLSISFSPTAIGSDTATLAVSSNDETNPTMKVILRGRAGTGELKVPHALTFSSEVGHTQIMVLNLQNSGPSPLMGTVTGSLSGDPEFDLSGVPMPVFIPPGGHHAVYITFTPTSKGHTSTGTVNISIDGQDPATVNLQGTGK